MVEIWPSMLCLQAKTVHVVPSSEKRRRALGREHSCGSWGSSHCALEETNLTSIHENEGLIPSLDQWIWEPILPWAVVLDSMLLWLWYRLVAMVLIQPLAWEFPHAMGVPPPKKKKGKKKAVEVPEWLTTSAKGYLTDINATVVLGHPNFLKYTMTINTNTG